MGVRVRWLLNEYACDVYKFACELSSSWPPGACGIRGPSNGPWAVSGRSVRSARSSGFDLRKSNSECSRRDPRTPRQTKASGEEPTAISRLWNPSQRAPYVQTPDRSYKCCNIRNEYAKEGGPRLNLLRPQLPNPSVSGLVANNAIFAWFYCFGSLCGHIQHHSTSFNTHSTHIQHTFNITTKNQ